MVMTVSRNTSLFSYQSISEVNWMSGSTEFMALSSRVGKNIFLSVNLYFGFRNVLPNYVIFNQICL